MRLGVTHPSLMRFFASLRQIVYGVGVEHYIRADESIHVFQRTPRKVFG